MARGRPPNLLRSAAKQAGEKYYLDQSPCDFCGTSKRYVCNGACVACVINRSSARYAGLDEAAKADLRKRDAERYIERVTRKQSQESPDG